MVESFDWSGFYTTLCRHGPSLLVGINEGLRDVIGEVASTTDMFWSQGLQVLLEQGAADGNLRGGVLADSIFDAKPCSRRSRRISLSNWTGGR